jgi:hypothetical protein
MKSLYPRRMKSPQPMLGEQDIFNNYVVICHDI